MDNETRENLCAGLRAVVDEFGKDSLKGAVVVGNHTVDHLSDLPYIHCPTVSIPTLGGDVDYKVARFFEDRGNRT